NGVTPEKVEYKIHTPLATPPRRVDDEPILVPHAGSGPSHTTTNNTDLTHSSAKASTNATILITSSSVPATSWPMPPANPSPKIQAVSTTPCSFTAASALAKPTSSKLSAMPFWPTTPG